MWQAFIRGERGSVSAVSITLLLAALILLMVIVDREWINYTLKLAEQTADFAAEAGARSHEVYTTLEVNRVHYEWVYVGQKCATAEDGVTICIDEYDWLPFPDTITLAKTRERDLVNNKWKELARCGNPQWSGSSREYECISVRVVRREVEFPEATEPLAEDTFMVNWTDRSSAMLIGVNAIAIADNAVARRDERRSVIVTARLDVRSLFGLLRWRAQPRVVGRAVVTLSPLNIRP